MTVLSEIKEGLANVKANNVLCIESLEKDYSAWIIKFPDRYGVGIIIDESIVISESFSNAKLKTEHVNFENSNHYMITLTTNIDELRNEFAVLCAQFVDPGVNGQDRKLIVQAPRDWWEKWITLLGNSIRNKQPYQLLAEMIMVKYLLKMSKNPKWIGYKGQSHDIEYENGTCEVKSTLQRYGFLVDINSQFQLKAETYEFNLGFLRFEPTPHGVSINSIARDLVDLGYSKDELDFALDALGYEVGAGTREQTYTILDAKLYPVSDSFPKITNLSFIEGKIPYGIVKIKYTIDLENLDCTDFLKEL